MQVLAALQLLLPLPVLLPLSILLALALLTLLLFLSLLALLLLLTFLDLLPLAPLALLLQAAQVLTLLTLLLLLALLRLLLQLPLLVALPLLSEIVSALRPVSGPFTRIVPLAPAELPLVQLGQRRTARGDPPVRGVSRGRGQAGCHIHIGSWQRTCHGAKDARTGEGRRQRRGGEEKTGEELKAHRNPDQRLANHSRR